MCTVYFTPSRSLAELSHLLMLISLLPLAPITTLETLEVLARKESEGRKQLGRLLLF